jgi:hypothetical protein
MFWNTSKDAIIEPFNKFKFVAQFNVFQYSQESNPLNGYTGEEPSRFHLAVKKIDLPKINFEFERAYANEQVHYFQKGSIHWEPINITFIDAGSSNFSQFTNVSYFFQSFIKDLNAISLRPSFSTFAENRTGLIDSPVLCNNITITNFGRIANKDYPTYSNSKLNQKIEVLEQSFVDSSKFGSNVFIIQKPRLIKVDFGSMDYSSDEINEVSITVVPEWCEG